MNKTSISVPEMRKMLGMKKVESYWLVKQGHFQVIVVGGKMRIMVDSFEEWYNSQFHYKKVDGPEPGQKWPPSWSVPEVAELLRRSTTVIYDLMKKEHPFQTFTVDGQMRIRKDSFEEWYQAQSHYKKQEDAAPQELLDATLSVGEVSKMLGIHRNSVYDMINRRHLFEIVVVDDKIRIYKNSFEAWLNSQDKHGIIIIEEED
jgi:excisionase family DNA binding protein